MNNAFLARKVFKQIKVMIMKENEKSLRALAMLRYQAKHYQSIGYGSKSQAINAKIRRMLNELSTDAANK